MSIMRGTYRVDQPKGIHERMRDAMNDRGDWPYYRDQAGLWRRKCTHEPAQVIELLDWLKETAPKPSHSTTPTQKEREER